MGKLIKLVCKKCGGFGLYGGSAPDHCELCLSKDIEKTDA